MFFGSAAVRRGFDIKVLLIDNNILINFKFSYLAQINLNLINPLGIAYVDYGAHESIKAAS